MKTFNETNLKQFNAWQGAVETKERILKEGKEEEFDFLIQELYPQGLSETQLNDILWFSEEWLFEHLGINEDEEVMSKFEKDWDEACDDTDDIEYAQDEVIKLYKAQYPSMEHLFDEFLQKHMDKYNFQEKGRII